MKKKLPLNIIKNFQPKDNENISLVRPEDGKDFILHFSDIDPESNFYFRINRFDEKANKFHCECIPSNTNSIAKFHSWLSIDELNRKFDGWLKIISEYNELETIFDDPILKGFQDEYFDSFELIDEGSSTQPLKSSQILMLDQHLTEIEEKIDAFKTPENTSAIDSVKEEIKDLKSELSKKPKKWIVKKLSLIWAKMTKEGTPIIKEFLNEGKKELIKQGIKFLIESGDKLL